MPIRTMFALAIAITVTAGKAAAQFPRVRDSAGIHIVENSSRRMAPTVFTLTEPPLFEFGGGKGNPADLLDPRNAYDVRDVRLSSGEHVLIDRHQVRFYDAAGKQFKVAGHEGSGPQQFTALVSICRTRGDTIVVADVGNQRASILDKSGNFVREFNIGTADVTQNSCFDDGTFLVREYHRAAGPRSPMHVVRRRLDGTVTDTLGDFWPGEFNIYIETQVGVVASGEYLYVGDPRSSRSEEVRPRREAGRHHSHRRPDRESERRRGRQDDADGGGMGSGADMDSKYPRPTEWPSYGRIYVDPGGRLWVQDTPKSRNDPLLWTAFDRDGKMLGKFLMSASTSRADPRVMSFTEDGVQIRREDSDGALHVMTYRFGKQ